MDKILIGLVLAVVGFVTFYFGVEPVLSILGVELGALASLVLAGVFALVLFVVGLFSEDAALNSLEDIWGVIWRIPTRLVYIVRSILG